MSKYHRTKNKNSLVSILTHFLITSKEKLKSEEAIKKARISPILANKKAKKFNQIKTNSPYKNTYKNCDEITPQEKNSPKLTTSFLLTIDWKNYENLCVEYLCIKSCYAKPTTTGADGGIDIKITNSKHQLIGIAQCKAWSRKIGVNLVRELFGVMASEQVEKGIFFTTSIFTVDAIEFCKNKKILLVDGDTLINRINKLEKNQQAQLITVATEGDYTTPTCARCDKKMVLRVSGKGRNIGQKFWGCCNFPRCRGIINLKQ